MKSLFHPQLLLMIGLSPLAPPVSQTLSSSSAVVSFPTFSADEATYHPHWKVSARSQQAVERETSLQEKLSQEANTRAAYLDDPSLLNQARTWIQDLSELPFEQAAVELAPENVIKFTLVFPEEAVAMISLPLDQPQEPAVFSLFQYRERLLSELKPLDQVILGLQRWIEAD